MQNISTNTQKDLREAVKMLGVPEDFLTEIISAGRLKFSDADKSKFLKTDLELLMKEDIYKDKYVSYASVRLASAVLGVSLDTLRRWDKRGILRSIREIGRMRYYSCFELLDFKIKRPLLIHDAAKTLGISVSTLRRIENRGLISPLKSDRGLRLYDRKMLSDFVASGKYAPLAFSRLSEIKNAPQEIISVNSEKKLAVRRSTLPVIYSGATVAMKGWTFLIGMFTMAVAFSSMAYTFYPESTVSFYKKSGTRYDRLIKQKDQEGYGNIKAISGNVLYPVSKTSLMLVRTFDENSYRKAVAAWNPDDRVLGDKVSRDETGISFKITGSSVFDLNDMTLIENLSADYLRGYAPGTGPNDLLLLNESGQVDLSDLNIEGLGAVLMQKDIPGSKLADNSVGKSKLEEDSIYSVNIKNGEIKEEDLADGSVGAAKIRDGAVTSEKIADGAVTESKLAKGSVSSESLKDGAVTASKMAGRLTFQDGTYIDLSAIGYKTGGFRLPLVNSSELSDPVDGEGFIAWDTETKRLFVFDGSKWNALFVEGALEEATEEGEVVE